MESAASGILAGKNLARRSQGKAPLILPRETMMGALAAYISSAPTENFQPMGANMGILPDLPERLVGDPALQASLRANGLDFVRDERNWRNSVERYVEVYGSAIQAARTGQ